MANQRKDCETGIPSRRERPCKRKKRKKRKAFLAICCPVSVKGARGVGGVPIATKGQTLLYSSIYLLCVLN